MQFVNLKKQYQRLEEDVKRRIHQVLAHGQYILGPEVTELEEKLAAFVGVKHCISVGSGTDALLMAMMALGIGPGDEVITSPFTFIATAETIALLGAQPVYADIDPKTYNLDPAQIAAKITDRTKLIIPVSLYGQCADMAAINTVAAQHQVPVMEDGAQSLGATYHGRQSCSLSLIGCTSFFPSKPLGCYGDGGACFTDDDVLAKTLREIRVHGQDRRYHHPLLGINGRFDTIQAAVLLAKLSIFDEEIVLRQQIAERYTNLLRDTVVTPYLEPFNTSVYAQYTVQVEDRDAVIAKCQAYEVPTAVHYPIPLYRQPIFKADCDCPHTEHAAARVMSLPMSPYLTKAEQELVCQALTT